MLTILPGPNPTPHCGSVPGQQQHQSAHSYLVMSYPIPSSLSLYVRMLLYLSSPYLPTPDNVRVRVRATLTLTLTLVPTTTNTSTQPCLGESASRASPRR